MTCNKSLITQLPYVNEIIVYCIIWVNLGTVADQHSAHSAALTDSASGPSRSLSVENGEEGELEMELPPPMKVLEQPMSAAAAQGGQGTAAATSGPPMPPLDNILTDVPTRVSLPSVIFNFCLFCDLLVP